MLNERGGSHFEFAVFGDPAPQGSKTVAPTGGMWEKSKKVRPWRDAITAEVMRLGLHKENISVPVKVTVEFVFKRPKTHYYTGRNSNVLRENAPEYKANPPDGDKLLRSTYDGLTESGIIKDDALIVEGSFIKRYGPQSGAVIHIERK